MKRWLKRLTLGLLLAVVLLAGAITALLGSRPGAQWLLETGNRFIPGELAAQRVQGSLLGDLRLFGLAYETPDISVHIGEVVFRWAPSALFSGIFHLQELSVDQLRYEQLREAEEKPSESFALADIELPIQLKLDLVQARKVAIVSSPDAAPVTIDELVLVAAWDDAGVQLSRLDLAMPELQFQGRGKVLPTGKYPLDLDVNWQLHAEGLPSVSGRGRIQGNVETLRLQHQIDGDAKAELTLNAHDLLHQLTWDTKVEITRLPKEYLPLEEPVRFGLQIDAKGDLEQAEAQVSLRIPDPDAPAAARQLLNLTAGIRFSDQRFQLQGDWKDLQWPLAGAAQIAAPAGELKVSGIPDDYLFSLQSDLRGEGIPPGNWRVQGRGGLKQLRLEKLLGEILDGRLEASGDLRWSPSVAWNMDMVAADIDPATIDAQWPGRLSLSVSTSGELPDTGLQLQAQIRELQGFLREQPLAGRGSIRIDGDTLLLEDVTFSSGQAKIAASGVLGETLDLAWQLDVPDMADLLPQGAGEIHGSGKLGGTRKQPVVKGKIKVADLLANAIQCARCDVEFSVGLDEAFVSRISIATTDVLVSGQKISGLSLEMSGPLREQTLDLLVDHPQGKLKFAAVGSYLQEQAAWQGEIKQLGLNAGEFGNWKLKRSASLLAAAQELQLSPLCLQDQQAELCLQIDREAGAGNAQLMLKGLVLERAQPWLPPEIHKLTGVLNLQATVDLGAALKARVEANLEPGVLAYRPPAADPISLELHDGKLSAVYDEKELMAQWKLGLGENLVEGKLRVPREALDKDPLAAPMQGWVKLAVRELNLIKAFVPEIQKIDGNIDVALDLSGQLGDPRISGHAILKSSEIIVPRAGLKLRDLLVQIKGDGGQRLDVYGGIAAGEGALDLRGVVTLDAQQGWPAKLVLKGERFQLLDLPEAQVVISPDLNIESSKDLIRIRGSLDLPVARIQLHDLPEGSRDVSPDVVIANENGEIEEAPDSRVDAEVVITLGEDVNFRGFGLHADLGGKLTIDQKAGKFPTANGELKIESGSFRAYGQDLTIEQGRISYAGGRIDNPGLRLRASRKTGDTTVGVELTGTVKKPQLSTFSSDPDMRKKDVISMLLTGQKTGDLSEAKIYTGRQITPDLSVGVNLGAGEEGSEFVARYKLRDNINLEGTSSAQKSGASINYVFELE
ncbi:translocation/assembly module TamB domain-containing protein [Thiolapillus sp.]